MARARLPTVGIVGLGKMGFPIAQRLVENGVAVFGTDVDQDAMKAAARQGVKVRSTPVSVAEAAEVTMVLVGEESHVGTVCFDNESGLLRAPGDRTVVICSTISPDMIYTIAECFQSRGGPAALVDAPLCRGEIAAVKGELLVLASGETADVDRCMTIFNTFASDVFYLGGLGAGQVAKMVNNLLLWTTISINAEGIRLAQHYDIDIDVLRDALLKSTSANWALQSWRMPRDMPWAEKDMSIIVEYLDRIGSSSPVAHAAQDAIARLKADKVKWQGSRSEASLDEYLKGSFEA